MLACKSKGTAQKERKRCYLTRNSREGPQWMLSCELWREEKWLRDSSTSSWSSVSQKWIKTNLVSHFHWSQHLPEIIHEKTPVFYGTYKKIYIWCHQNIRGLSTKINHLLRELFPSLSVLTEHGFKQSDIDSTKLKGYTLVSEYHRKNTNWGGVATYCKEN